MKKRVSRKNFTPRENLYITKRASPSKETLERAARIKVKLIGSKDLNIFCDKKDICKSAH